MPARSMKVSITPRKRSSKKRSARSRAGSRLDYPRNVRGVADVPGLFFLGLLWQHSQASASLVGPELDGPDLREAMARHARRARAQSRSRISA